MDCGEVGHPDRQEVLHLLQHLRRVPWFALRAYTARPGSGRLIRRLAITDEFTSAGASRRPTTGPRPVDRVRPGSKHHVITDARGTSLAIALTAGNGHDVAQLLPLPGAMPHLKGRADRPRHRPRQVFADRGCDFDKYRHPLWRRGVKPVIACCGVPHASGFGTVR